MSYFDFSESCSWSIQNIDRVDTFAQRTLENNNQFFLVKTRRSLVYFAAHFVLRWLLTVFVASAPSSADSEVSGLRNRKFPPLSLWLGFIRYLDLNSCRKRQMIQRLSAEVASKNRQCAIRVESGRREFEVHTRQSLSSLQIQNLG